MDYSNPYFKLHPAPETPEDEICHCAEPPPINLMAGIGENPLNCIDCNLEIRPESLDLDMPLIDLIADWNSLHNSIYHLWLASGEYEEWAQRELEDIDSPVNRRGLELLERMNRIRLCYYRYFQDQSADDYAPIQRCPKCGGAFRLYEDGFHLQNICDRCKIIVWAE
jgi:hypothetical protein